MWVVCDLSLENFGNRLLVWIEPLSQEPCNLYLNKILI